MSKKKPYRGKKNQKRKPNLKNQHQNQNNNSDVEVQIKQIQFFLGQLSRKFQGLLFGFDSYIRMNGDDEKLNKYIKDVIETKKTETKKTQEKKDDEPTRGDSESSIEKPVGAVPQDGPPREA